MVHAPDKGLKADSSLLTERCHLNNLTETLGPRAKLALDGIHNHDLDGYLQRRLEQAERATVKKERQTIVSLFSWAVRQGPALGFGKHDGRHWSASEFRSFVPNGTSSKPTFDRFRNLYIPGLAGGHPSQPRQPVGVQHRRVG